MTSIDERSVRQRAPLLSFIVLSYNYERYIAKTLKSIQDQTIQDFEVVIVDDHSTDRSIDVVRGFADPRFRLFSNNRNLGGAASYNLAVSHARGEWLVNLDADDWIAPQKSERQLQAIRDDPRIDIVGTYISVFDENDARHSQADSIEQLANQTHDLNSVDPWIGANHLCRSSTMVRASQHRRIGLDDADMVRAPDYELWTRALRAGCRFAVLPERLTAIRTHSLGVTHADPAGSLREMGYAMMRNLVPLADERSLYGSINRMIEWVATHKNLSLLNPGEAFRLLGVLGHPVEVNGYQDFVDLLRSEERYPSMGLQGKINLSGLGPASPSFDEIRKLNRDIEAYIEARDYWRAQSSRWERSHKDLEEHMSGRLAAQHAELASVHAEEIARLREQTRLRQVPSRIWSRLTRRKNL